MLSIYRITVLDMKLAGHSNICGNKQIIMISNIFRVIVQKDVLDYSIFCDLPSCHVSFLFNLSDNRHLLATVLHYLWECCYISCSILIKIIVDVMAF